MRERDGSIEPLRACEPTTMQWPLRYATQPRWPSTRDFSTLRHSGSMEPLLVWGCKAALTGARTTELSELTE